MQAHWVVLFVAAGVAPVLAAQAAPEWIGPALLGSAAVLGGVVGSALAWRRGLDAGALAPLVAAVGVVVAIGYGAIAPGFNRLYGHRALAAEIDRVVPADCPTILFVNEIDEGLWSYLKGHRLAPVPGTQPRYNRGFDLAEDVRKGSALAAVPAARAEAERQRLLEAIRVQARAGSSPFLLLREKTYASLARDLAPIARPLIREADVKRNGLVLLDVSPAAVAGPAGGDTSSRR